MPAKGGNYEREFSRSLSMWWSGGERDDLFWRSSQSGGRATVRARKGLKTAGHCGDIAATDEVGAPLTKLITFEAKRGYDDAYPWRMFDSPSSRRGKSPTMLEKFIQQSKTAAANAGTPYWALVTRRDRKCEIIYLPAPLMKLAMLALKGEHAEFFKFHVYSVLWGKMIPIYGMHLETFFKIDPKEVRKWQD